MNYGESLRDRLKIDRIGPKLSDLTRKVMAPYAVRTTPLRSQTFVAWDKPLPYFVHRYNVTWLNERCIEIPLAQEFLRSRSGHGLEFGNVLGHYGIRGDWVIVDKYEPDASVTNVDIVDFMPDRPFDYIIGISTIEHVGWDEPQRDQEKTLRAFDHLRSMLGPGGKMLLTAPLGYNSALDSAVLDARWATDRQACFVKNGHGGWRQEPTVRVVPWGPDDIWPPSVWVAEVGPEGG